MSESDTRPPWNVGKTAGFRWFSIFSLLYISPAVSLTSLAVPWTGRVLLGLGEVAFVPTGSGDTTAHYAQLFLHALLATLGTGLWTILGRSRDRYSTLLHWFTFFVRLKLATTMITYGVLKLVEGQFVPPSDARLFQTFGDASPMGLLWTFMGYSKAYTAFTGLAEVLGGVLLLSRRTKTLGALVVVGVMSNVVMLNFCYDVPVKLMSSQLLMWALFLVALDWRRLYALFTNTGNTERRVLPQLFRRAKAHLAGQILKALTGLFFISWAAMAMTFFAPPDPSTTAELRGTYEVMSFARDGVEIAPLVTIEDRWHHVLFSKYDGVTILDTAGSKSSFRGQLDGNALQLTRKQDGEEELTTLTVTRDDAGTLRLKGEHIEAVLVPHEREFLLRSRGFHWIQESPFNR